MQFYWNLNVYSYPAPTQQSPTWNIQVTAQALLSYSKFNIRIALKLLLELPLQQAQKHRTAGDGQYFTGFGFLWGETGCFLPASGILLHRWWYWSYWREKLNQRYNSNAVSEQNLESLLCKRGSSAPVGISTKQTAERGSGLERDLIGARLHFIHTYTHTHTANLPEQST